MAYWACARFELRREAVAQHFLELGGFTTYLPKLRSRHIRGDRRVEKVELMFPSYGFVAITNGWHGARWSIGVVSLIMSGDRPAVVPDAVLADIRAREVGGVVELPARELRRGDAVRITRGVFRDQLALYQGMSGHERCAVLLGALGKVTLPAGDVEAEDLLA
jgi:transcriptional antiterminator RfaH